MTPPEGSGWSSLEAPRSILGGGLRAPVAFPRQPPRAYRVFLEKLLEESGVPGGALQTAIATGSGILEGASEIVEQSNRLVDPASGLADAKAAARGLLLASGALLGHRNAAYVLQQVGEILRSRPGAAAREAPRISRRKDLLTPLEAAFERLGLHQHLEPERAGPLLVRLDEIYDDATVQIERALHLASLEIGEARALAPEFLTRLYRDFARASFGDHLLAEHEKGKESGEGTGLLDLLRELGEALERA